ncbi:CRISPR-associated endonuclease Cas1, partial [Mycobacterium tuberculosis]|nr:CRISPR-associated endonuclease Cas1 [Mycobacterium tuberculosis]
QYRVSEAPEEVVRSIVVGKIANQRSVLQRALRDYGEAYTPAQKAAIAAAVDRLARILARVERLDATLDALRGSEGEAAQSYFAVFDALIR